MYSDMHTFMRKLYTIPTLTHQAEVVNLLSDQMPSLAGERRLLIQKGWQPEEYNDSLFIVVGKIIESSTIHCSLYDKTATKYMYAGATIQSRDKFYNPTSKTWLSQAFAH